MKKVVILVMLICFSKITFAQLAKSLKNLPQGSVKVNKQVPPVYLDTHFFIQNTSNNPTYLSFSIDSVNWKEMRIAARGTIDMPVEKFVYLKILTTETNYFLITAYPKNYYLIVFDNGQKKWIIKKQ